MLTFICVSIFCPRQIYIKTKYYWHLFCVLGILVLEHYTLVSSFVDNHEDLGELLVDKNGEDLSKIIRNKISEAPHTLDHAIFSVIEHMAEYTANEASGVPSFSNNAEDTNHYDKVIMELTIINLGLPKNTLVNKSGDASDTPFSNGHLHFWSSSFLVVFIFGRLNF